jgi:DNA polymerase I-like protein with 3'-5' exonuclease and polymerase domains
VEGYYSVTRLYESAREWGDMIEKLVKQIAPDMDAKRVIATEEKAIWYKSSNGHLYVPTLEILRNNHDALSSTVEVIAAASQLNESFLSPYTEWDNTSHSVLTTLQDIQWLHDTICKYRVVAVDIETRNVEWEGNAILAIGFAYSPTTCAIVDMTAIDGTAIAELQRLFSNPDITFVWHNGKFDCARLKFCAGIDARVDEDTMLMHFATINERRGTHGLKDLGKLYLQAPPWDDELQAFKKSYARKHKILLADFTYDLIPKDTLYKYLHLDCIATLRLCRVLRQLQIPGTEFIYRTLCRASNPFARIETRGFEIDADALRKLEVELRGELAILTAEFDKLVAPIWHQGTYMAVTGAKSAPYVLNPKSPKQLQWLLSRVVGHSLASTDVTTLSALAKDHPIIDRLMRMRGLDKQIDTYVEGFKARICADGRLRSSFNLHGTETGRLSSNNPNFQNIPREGGVKKLFVAQQGAQLIELDYSQAEVRTLAYLAQDEFLHSVYVAGRDVHSETAQRIYGDNWTAENRNACKRIIFGLVYGRGAKSVAEQLGWSVAHAQGLMTSILDSMPQAKDWILEQRRKATHGEPCITALGRHRHMFLTSRAQLNHVQNTYINTPVQSLAGDFTLFSVLAIQSMLEARYPGASIVSTVHDSIIIECPTRFVPDVVRQSIDIMEGVPRSVLPDCTIPFVADCKVGTRWGELQEWKGGT